MEKIVLVCEDTFDGILTAIYEAWTYKGKGVNIITEGEYNYDLFSEYINIETDYEKSKRVADSICNKISTEALEIVYNVSISAEKDKGSVILAFLIYGFKKGYTITKELTNPYVQRVYDIRKKVWNESHFYLEILRFEELPGKILCARITPRANIMVGVMEHFSDRFPDENFVIYDENRKLCGIHEYRSRYYIRNEVELDILIEEYYQRIDKEVSIESGDIYTDLWKVFFSSISIRERENYKLQRNNVPILYRKHMVEFEKIN